MIARASSGSRSRIISVEFLISANSAVTVLRSPSGSAPAPDSSLKIFCASGDPRGRAGSGDRRGFRRGVPHSPQNLNCGGFSAPQFGQTASSGAPQLPQNLVVSGFSEVQLGQRISPPPQAAVSNSLLPRSGAQGVTGTLATVCASVPCVFFDRRSCEIGRRTGPNAHQYQKDASQARLIRGLARQRLRQSRIRAILLSMAKERSLVIIAHPPTAPFETGFRPLRSSRNRTGRRWPSARRDLGPTQVSSAVPRRC